ncbi:MAG: SDR family oxidoreductase [Anaerolineaceae bacterium]|nr:SDR family oxidoreductase [Anaerolineaceae bacterium]
MNTPGAERPFENRVVLVTGASRGIGQAAALAFAAQGAALAVHYRSNGSGAIATVGAIEKAGGSALPVRADLCDLKDSENLIETVENKLGPIHVLVNNAGLSLRRTFLDTTPQEFDELLGINLRGPYFLSQMAARHMTARKQGCILFISSILARLAIPQRSAYCAAKGALESLTRALAIDLLPYHIRVNAIAPGLVRTDMLLDSFEDAAEEARVRGYVPSGRFGEPEELARVITFLASDAASYINGALIPVDSALGILEAGPPLNPPPHSANSAGTPATA